MPGGEVRSRKELRHVGKKYIICIGVYVLQCGTKGGQPIFPPHAIHGRAMQQERQGKRKPEDFVGKSQREDFCHRQNWKRKFTPRIIRTPIGVGYRNVRNFDNPRADRE